MNDTLLSVENLSVEYRQHGQFVPALHGVDLQVRKGETLALVGESGCGKSTLALSVIGLLPKNESRVPGGSIVFEGENLFAKSDEELRRIRGKKIAMIFQDPFSSLNPVLTVGYQLLETSSPRQSLSRGPGFHLGRTWAPANDMPGRRRRALELLEEVQLAEPERIFRSYPHQISGGQRQRVMIAMAIAQGPDLLIADEPTTALDVTVQDEIVKLLKRLQQNAHMAMLFVTHNLGLVKDVAQNVAVMQAGKIVETGPSAQVLSHPRHPYTQNLLECVLSLKKK